MLGNNYYTHLVKGSKDKIHAGFTAGIIYMQHLLGMDREEWEEFLTPTATEKNKAYMPHETN